MLTILIWALSPDRGMGTAEAIWYVAFGIVFWYVAILVVVRVWRAIRNALAARSSDG